MVVCTIQPAASAPVTVYVVPAHKPLTLFPTAVGPAGEKLYVNDTALLKSKVPSQPGLQLAGVLETTVGAAGELNVPIVTVVVDVQPFTLDVPVIVYITPEHNPLMLFPTIAGITAGLIVYTIFGTLFIVAVPSHPGLQLAFVVLNTLIAAAEGFTKVNVLDCVQLFASAAITV